MKREDFDAYYAHAMPLDIPSERIETLRALKCRFPLESIDKERTLSLREAAEDVGLFFELLRYSYAGYEFYRDKVDFPAVERQILDGLPAGGLTANTLRSRIHAALSPQINDSHFGLWLNANHALTFKATPLGSDGVVLRSPNFVGLQIFRQTIQIDAGCTSRTAKEICEV